MTTPLETLPNTWNRLISEYEQFKWPSAKSNLLEHIIGFMFSINNGDFENEAAFTEALSKRCGSRVDAGKILQGILGHIGTRSLFHIFKRFRESEQRSYQISQEMQKACDDSHLGDYSFNDIRFESVMFIRTSQGLKDENQLEFNDFFIFQGPSNKLFPGIKLNITDDTGYKISNEIALIIGVKEKRIIQQFIKFPKNLGLKLDQFIKEHEPSNHYKKPHIYRPWLNSILKQAIATRANNLLNLPTTQGDSDLDSLI